MREEKKKRDSNLINSFWKYTILKWSLDKAASSNTTIMRKKEQINYWFTTYIKCQALLVRRRVVIFEENTLDRTLNTISNLQRRVPRTCPVKNIVKGFPEPNKCLHYKQTNVTYLPTIISSVLVASRRMRRHISIVNTVLPLLNIDIKPLMRDAITTDTMRPRTPGSIEYQELHIMLEWNVWILWF